MLNGRYQESNFGPIKLQSTFYLSLIYLIIRIYYSPSVGKESAEIFKEKCEPYYYFVNRGIATVSSVN